MFALFSQSEPKSGSLCELEIVSRILQHEHGLEDPFFFPVPSRPSLLFAPLACPRGTARHPVNLLQKKGRERERERDSGPAVGILDGRWYRKVLFGSVFFPSSILRPVCTFFICIIFVFVLMYSRFSVVVPREMKTLGIGRQTILFLRGLTYVRDRFLFSRKPRISFNNRAYTRLYRVIL